MRDIFPELDARARRGDAAAACRLGAELQRCRMRHLLRYGLDEDRVAESLAQQGLTPEQTERQADLFLQRMAQYEKLKQVCANFAPEQAAVPARYFAMAADAGHHPSMIRFALSAFDINDIFRDPGLVNLLKTQGPEFFRRALQAGEPGALTLMLIASMEIETGGPLSYVVPAHLQDPLLLRALIERLEQTYPGSTTSLHGHRVSGDPTPEHRAQAEEIFRHFADSPRFAAASDRWAAKIWSTEDVEHYRCAEQ